MWRIFKTDNSQEDGLLEGNVCEEKKPKPTKFKGLKEEDLCKKMAERDNFSWERSKDLDERIQKRDKGIDHAETIDKLVSLYADVKDSSLKTVLDGLVALGRLLSAKTDETEEELRSQYTEIVRKMREKGIEPRRTDNQI